MKLSYDGIFPSIVRGLHCSVLQIACYLGPHRNYEDSVHKLLVTTLQSAALQAPFRRNDAACSGQVCSITGHCRLDSILVIKPLISRFTGFTASDAHYSPIFLSCAELRRGLGPK